ncbi:MAG: hypothetical protein MJ179_04940 [Treponema sp.]|nr:hypothetical protein [Treponema sp.]
MKKILIFALVLLAFVSCKTVGQKDSQCTYIMVYDFENNTVKNVQIYIDGESIGFTDVYGRCTVEGFQNGNNHEVMLVKEDYEKIIVNTTLDDQKVLYIKMGSSFYYANLAESYLDKGMDSEALKAINKALSIKTREDYLFLQKVIKGRLGDE